MVRLILVRHAMTTLAVATLVALPLTYVGSSASAVPSILFWSALVAAVENYWRLHRDHLLPSFDNLRVSVVAWLAGSFAVFQVIGFFWIVYRW